MNIIKPVFLITISGLLFVPIPDYVLGILYLITLGITIVLVLAEILSNKSLDKIQNIIFLMPVILLEISILFSRNIIMWKSSELEQVTNSKSFNWIVFLIISIVITVLNNVFIRKEVGKVSLIAAMFNLNPMNANLFLIDNLKAESKLSEDDAERLRSICRTDIDHITFLYWNAELQKFVLNVFTINFVINLVCGSIIGFFFKRFDLPDVLSIVCFWTFINTILLALPMFFEILLINVLLKKEKANEERWELLFQSNTLNFFYEDNKDKKIKNRLSNELKNFKISILIFTFVAIFCSSVPLFTETQNYLGIQAISFYCCISLLIFVIPINYYNESNSVNGIRQKLNFDNSLITKILEIYKKWKEESKQPGNIYSWISPFIEFYDSFLVFYVININLILCAILLKIIIARGIVFSIYYGITALILVMQYCWFRICSNNIYNIFVEWMDEELYGNLLKEFMIQKKINRMKIDIKIGL